MPIARSILPQFDHEMARTRKTLERVPDDKLEWRAHPKCNTIGLVAAHLADIPSSVKITMKRDSFDVNPVGGQPYRPARPATRREIVAGLYDKMSPPAV